MISVTRGVVKLPKRSEIFPKQFRTFFFFAYDILGVCGTILLSKLTKGFRLCGNDKVARVTEKKKKNETLYN